MYLNQTVVKWLDSCLTTVWSESVLVMLLWAAIWFEYLRCINCCVIISVPRPQTFAITFLLLSPHSVPSPLSNLLLKPTISNWPMMPDVVSQRSETWHIRNMLVGRSVDWLMYNMLMTLICDMLLVVQRLKLRNLPYVYWLILMALKWWFILNILSFLHVPLPPLR